MKFSRRSIVRLIHPNNHRVYLEARCSASVLVRLFRIAIEQLRKEIARARSDQTPEQERFR